MGDDKKKRAQERYENLKYATTFLQKQKADNTRAQPRSKVKGIGAPEMHPDEEGDFVKRQRQLALVRKKKKEVG